MEARRGRWRSRRTIDIWAFRDRRDASPSGVNSLGAGPWHVFDLRGRGWASAAKQGGFEPVPCLETLDGWAVVPTEEAGVSLGTS